MSIHRCRLLRRNSAFSVGDVAEVWRGCPVMGSRSTTARLVRWDVVVSTSPPSESETPATTSTNSPLGSVV